MAGLDDSGKFLVVRDNLSIPLNEIQLRVSRSSGPGGQHANVTESKVEAVFDVIASRSLTEVQRQLVLNRLGSKVTATAQDGRSQTRNKFLALERLGARLAEALHVVGPRRVTRPTRASREQRLLAKRYKSERKQARRKPRSDDF